MLKDITLGQFFPGKSIVHRLDPRTKLVMLIVYIVALFVASYWISYGVMFLFLATCIAISRIPVKAIVRGMKPLVIILIFTGLLNIFFTSLLVPHSPSTIFKNICDSHRYMTMSKRIKIHTLKK